MTMYYRYIFIFSAVFLVAGCSATEKPATSLPVQKINEKPAELIIKRPRLQAPATASKQPDEEPQLTLDKPLTIKLDEH